MIQIKLKTNLNDLLQKRFKKVSENTDRAILWAFHRACQEAVSFAKGNRPERYTDQSGALNASTGFMLYRDGELVSDFFEASGGDGSGSENGVNAGKNTASKRAQQLGAHICAVIVAGMPYAVYVEAKGRDVLTGAERMMPAYLEKWLKLAFKGAGLTTDFEIS